MIALSSIYDERGDLRVDACDFLYKLLKDRTPEQSISHRRMPTVREHTHYLQGRPHPHWYLIELLSDLTVKVGTIYLTNRSEIGITIEKGHQRQGYGRLAVQILMRRFQGRRFLWNVNPANTASVKMVEQLGGRLIQHTYEI